MSDLELVGDEPHDFGPPWPDGHDPDSDRPEPEWCEDCGCPRYIADRSWEVDVSRDGPDGPEYLVAVLDCDHQLTLAGPRGQYHR